MYTLVHNDIEFEKLGFNNCKDKPLGYPCVVSFNDGILYIVYPPPNIKCIDSFVAGTNAVKTNR